MNRGFNPSFLLQQFAYAGPFLLIYVFAIFMAVTYMSRAQRASILTLIGAVISIVTTLGLIAIQAYIIGNPELREFVSMQTISLCGSCIRAVGFGMMVAAIFVDRNSPPAADRYLRE